MNEQAFQDAYNLFVSAGYKKSIDEFRNLIATNPQALQDSYNLFVGAGYAKDMPSYKALLGLSLGSQQTTAPRPNPNVGQQPQQQPQPQPQPEPEPEVQQELMQGVQEQPQPEQKKYNQFDYKAVPEQLEPSATRTLMSGVGQYIPGFEQSMQELEIKKKVASELELSAQKELVDYTSKQLESDILSDSLQYEKDKQFIPFIAQEGVFKDIYQQIQRENRVPEFIKNQLSQINEDLIGGRENRLGFSTIGVEERAVPKLNYMFGPLGFTFEEYGIGDNALVKAPNGESYVVELDNLTKGGDIEEVNKLKDFITKHSANIPNIANYAKEYAGSKKQFVDDQEVERAIEFNNTNADLLAANIQSFVDERTLLEKEKAALNSMPADQRNTPEFKLKSEAINNKYLDLAKQQQKVLQNTYELEAKQRLLKKSIGKYVTMQEKQGTWLGATVNWLSEGMGSITAGIASPIIDMSYSKYTGGISEKEMAAQVGEGAATGDIITDINNGGDAVSLAFRINKSLDAPYIPLPKKDQSYKDWYNSLTEEQKISLVDKSNDDLKKAAKKEALPVLRELYSDFYGNQNTTKQFQSLKEEGFWGGAYAGLVKSIPAMAMPGSWAGRTAAFFAMSTDAVNQEMEKNPAFADISEDEKLLITIPIGIANAVLEEVGLRNLIANKGLVNSLVVKGLQKAGVNATETTLSKIIKNDVESMLARGTLTLAGAGLAEAETGALQQMGEYAVKDIYNMAKEKKMFNTPDSLTEYVYDVVRAGAQEAVGGFIMGTPGAAAAAYRKRGFEGMSDDEFKTFEAIANDGKMQSSYIATLKSKVASGDMTMKEAKEDLNDYRRSVGVYRSVPSDLSIKAKKEAMNLVREKQVIEESIKDKDEALVIRQKARIQEINNKLNTLSENAVQEQATSEVPIQSEAGVGEEMEGGKPTTEPQVTTEEVKEEEVVPALATAEATTAALEALPENERSNIRFTQEDGTETPVMGNEKMLAELFQQAQAVPEEDRTDFHQNIIDAVTLSLSDQIEQEQVQLQEQEQESDRAYNFEDNEQVVYEADNLEDIPEQFRDRAIELGPQEITARKKILGLPVGKKEVIKRKGKTFKFVVTGAEVNANANLFDRLLFGANKKIKYDGTLERQARAANKAQVSANVTKSIAKVFSGMKITNFKNDAEMQAYAKKFGDMSNQIVGGIGGVFVSNVGGKSEILINDEIADATTLPHEVWHAVLTKAFGDNEALFQEFRDSIKKTLTNSGYTDIVTQLDNFSSKPEYLASNQQGEEWLVQLGALLTSSGVTLENLSPKAKTLLMQIKEVFNKIAIEITGQPMFLEDATAEDVLDFMVTVSDRMSRGEDISTFFRDVNKNATTKGESRISKQIGRKKKEEYAAKLAKERPDLDAEGLTADTISLIEKFGEENSQDGMGNPKLEKLAVHFISRSTVTLPEDGYKIVEAEKLAAKNKVDPFAFSNPLDIMEKFKDTIKEKPVDPDTLKEFTNKKSIPGSDIVVYDVEDTREGQAAVRRIIDTHFGKDSQPWCIAAKLEGDENMDKAWELWSTKYNKMPKKISFRNGKLSAFQASAIIGEEVWWDRRNEPFNGVPSTIQLGDNKKQLISLKEDGEVKEYFNIYRKSKELEEEWTADDVLIVKNAFKDGKKTSEERWYDDGQKRSEYLFDDKGFLEYMVGFYEDGTKSSETIREDNMPQESRKWHENGNLQRDIKFDESGNEIENTSFKEDGELDVKVITSYDNGKRKEVEITGYSEKQKQVTTTKTQYDNDGDIVSSVTTGEDGNLISKSTSNKDNSSSQIVVNKDGSLTEKNYNTYSELASEIKRDKDGKFISGFEYVDGRRYYLYSDPNVNFSFQRTGGGDGTLQEVRRIAQRYNVSNSGFAPSQINEFALDKELRPYGYSAKRAEPEPNGRQRGVYILNPKGRFFNPFKGKFQRIGSGDGTLQESLKTIPGYEDMIRKSKNIALRVSRRKDADWDRIMNAVMEFVMNSPVYTLANDSQREQMVRDVRAEYGKKEKTAPSPTKVFELPTVADLFGKIEDVKMITMPELQLLNEQMKTLVRGAKEARVNWMAISKQVAKQIKELALAGKISNRQAASVISRLAMVNMFNQDSIDKFTDYMVKVFTDANYDKKISDARKKLPRALKNLKKKIGVANAVAPSLFELFSINPNLIPDSVLERYLELVDMFGSSDSVLKLDDVSIVAGDVKKILDVINEEVSQSEELALRFEEFADKVYDEDGKLDYAKTIAKMIDQDAITDAEAEIMRKYKKIILPKVEAPEKTKAEIEEEKKALIKAIKATTINASNLPTRLERDLVKRLVELLKPEYLKNLSVNQLENVVKLIDNINNGYMPRYAMITVEKLNSVKKASEELVPATETAKPLRFSKAVGKVKSKFIKGSTAALEMIRRTPLAYIDQIFGDFNTKRIFNAVFEMMATGHAAFETDMNKVNKKLDDAHQAVANSHGKDANKTLEASFRMMAYMIQREYESNPGSDQVNPAARFIEATIDKIYDGKSKYKEADAALLEKILKDYGVDVGTDKNGNPIREIDNKKLYKSFNTAERGALKTIREINDGLTEKAQYTASIIRGESITPLNNYVHLPIMHDYNPNERSTGIQNSDAYNNSRRPSTKAKTLEGRSGDVSAINFDAFASAQKGAKATLLDFHLTEPIRTSRKTINEARKMLKESGKFKGQNRELINAIDSANEEVIRNVLTNNFITDNDIEVFVNEVSKQGYRAILASGERFTSELASNMAFAMISDPKSFVAGTKYKSIIMSPMAVDIMFNVSSKQTKRLFSSDNLSGRFIDTSIIGQASGVKSVTSKSAISNVSNIIYNKSLKKYKNYIELAADALISTPDKLVMRPVWFGSFANEFKNQTGVEIDFNKIAENDEAYMNKYSEAISNARDFADEKSILAGASDNPFMGIIKGSNNADQGYIKKIYNNFNNFMTRFAIYEFAAARQGIYAAMGDGKLTRKEGAALLAGVATRMTTYTLLTKILGGLVLSLFGIEDEDEETEKSFMQKFGQSLASTATSLIIGRDFGNAVKTISNFGVEKINEEFFTDLRNGEYDPYEDAISYSSVPRARPGNPIDLGDIALMFTGSFTPFAKTIDLGVRKAFEDAKKEPAAIERQKNEMLIRFPIEVLGNIGLIPMYKDVKNIVVGKIYEDLRKEMKSDKEAAKEREFEKKRLGIYESREDMRRYNPKLYEKTFGPSSPYYKQDQIKKEQERLKSEAKRAIKDVQFGYDPDKIPTKDEMTRSELKRYFPQDYYKKYGVGSPTYKEEQEERDMEKEVRDARQAQMDAYYGYQSESKTDKFGAPISSGNKTDKFGAPISKGNKTDKFGAPIK